VSTKRATWPSSDPLQLVSPVGVPAVHPAEARRERPDTAGANREADVCHRPVGHLEQGGGALKTPGQQVLVRGLAEGPLELPAEVSGRQTRRSGHISDGQRLGVTNVSQVTCSQQVPRERLGRHKPRIWRRSYPF